MPNTPIPVTRQVTEQDYVSSRQNGIHSTAELHLLLAWPDEQRIVRWRVSVVLSLIVHVFLFFGGIRLNSFIAREPAKLPASRKAYTKLYLPPDLLTQRAPNRNKVSKTFDLATLLAPQQAEQRLLAPTPGKIRRLEIPKETVPTKKPAQAPQIAAEVPKQIQPDNLPPNGVSDSVISAAPLPAPVPPANPTPNAGIEDPQPKSMAKIMPPKNSVQDVLHQMAKRDAQSASVVVSSSDAQPNLPSVPGQQGSPGQLGSTIELQTDPQGADFKPYLTRILAIVRRNWFNVLPDSARMGAVRGRTTIQFEVSRDGSIPKLVIADSSGVQPLDRAAIAGLSMSNPLPPLPAEFKGGFIRLQFSFNYHVPSL